MGVSALVLDAIVKAYDVRGLVDSQLTAEVVSALGSAWISCEGLAGHSVVIGHDMRPSSPVLADHLAEAARRAGADVIELGLCSTDMVYYASGAWNMASVMITASHNPASYNGLKFTKPGAKGMSRDTGLAAISEFAKRLLAGHRLPDRVPGERTTRDVLGEYAHYLHQLVPLGDIRPLRVVVDAANGMAGHTVPAVLGAPGVPVTVLPLYFELDGTFPNHEANPLDPANLVDLQAAVVEQGADLGLAFDGDADRCFVIDEKGNPVSPSQIGQLVALREISRARRLHPDQTPTVLYNLICSRAVPETIEAAGARAHRTPVGHSLIKDEMEATQAIFGAEHSAHYYFRDFWGADNGMLAALHVLAELGSGLQPMSSLASALAPYASSGEINSRVTDQAGVFARLRAQFADRARVDELDGLTFTGLGEPMWWLNVRASNTEPLVRLNVEASTPELMARIRDEALALIRQQA